MPEKVQNGVSNCCLGGWVGGYHPNPLDFFVAFFPYFLQQQPRQSIHILVQYIGEDPLWCRSIQGIHNFGINSKIKFVSRQTSLHLYKNVFGNLMLWQLIFYEVEQQVLSRTSRSFELRTSTKMFKALKRCLNIC